MTPVRQRGVSDGLIEVVHPTAFGLGRAHQLRASETGTREPVHAAWPIGRRRGRRSVLALEHELSCSRVARVERGGKHSA